MAYFTTDTLRFLTEIAKHNERPWFEKNRHRYESHVKEPAERLIADVEPKLRMRGKLMRIYRDVRFSKDKSPYKTNVGIGFHPPGTPKGPLVGGIYLHVQPQESFVATGCWRPESPLLAKIRLAIDADPAAWKKARKVGLDTDETDKLKRPPRGFADDHPFVEDLKLKSYTASKPLTAAQATSPRLPLILVSEERRMRPLNDFLVTAIS